MSTLPASMALARHITLVGLVALALSHDVLAYDFEVSARTEAHGYQLRRYDRDLGISFLNRRRVTQYLGLRIFNLLDPGQRAYAPGSGRAPALVHVTLLMRFFSDFGDFAEPRVELPELRNDELELLIGTVEGRNLFGFVDFTLGRQFDAEMMDFFGYDGLRLRLNAPWGGLFFETHVGVEVDRARPLSSAVFESDGVSGDGADEAIAPTFGVALGISRLRQFDFRLAYRGTASPADEPIDADGATRRKWAIDRELIFVSAGYRLPRLDTMLFAGLRHNLLLGSLDELSAGVSQPLGKRHLLRLEALRSRPHFDGDSIFNVFAVEPYGEVAGSYSFRPDVSWSLELRLGRRWFFRDEQQETGVSAGAISALAACRYGGLRGRGDLELFFVDGIDGRRGGADLFALYRTWRRVSLEGRVSLVASRDAGRVTDEAITTFGAQLGAQVLFVPGARLHLVIEDNVSRLYHSALRVLGILDLEFAP